jgi:hypothetical protein
MALDVGQTYRWTYEVRDASGALANATGITLTVTLPDQTTAAPAVTNPPAVAGKYFADYVLTQPGLHKFAGVTTAPGTAKTDWISAREYRSILSLDEGREFLGVLDTSRDEVIRSMLGGVTRLVERYVGTCVPRQITNEFIPGDIRDMIRLPSGPALSATAVTSVVSVWSGGPSWAAADVFADGTDVYPADGMSFTGGPWRWSGTAGRQVISDDILEGSKMALWDLWAVQRGISGDQQEPSLQESADFETSFASGWRLPPRVMQMLDGEHVPGFA